MYDVPKKGGLKMTICITCGLDSEKVSDRMPKHLQTVDSDGQIHWVDCESVQRHKLSFPELYEE